MITQKGKVLLVILGMCCMLAIGMPVEAREETDIIYDEGITVQYVNISNVIPSFSISGGNAKCSGTIVATYGKSCSVTTTLQRKSGSSWLNVRSWSSSGITTCSTGGTSSVSEGVSYRVKVTGTCGSESSTQYSATKSY